MFVMNILSEFFSSCWSAVAGIRFEYLVLILVGGFAVVFIAALLGCIFSAKIRRASKRPFFCFLNAYTALALGVFATGTEANKAIALTALFWFVGYLAYGFLCVISRPKKQTAASPAAVVSALPVQSPRREFFHTDAPAAKNGVRLEHALSITDKLLAKNLGKGDRQELEKMKTAFTVLQIKGVLSVQESAELNENFNALLKLMAKYNL